MTKERKRKNVEKKRNFVVSIGGYHCIQEANDDSDMSFVEAKEFIIKDLEAQIDYLKRVSEKEYFYG